MPFISYAQNYEDVILWRALRHVERGFYVDAGAFDPVVDSVTCAFYERGWSGINVEPLDEYFDKLTQARPRDTNLKVALGREVGSRTMWVFDGTGLSTLDPQIAAQHQAAGFVAKEMLVPVLTLAKILEDRAPLAIHFLKIDVEGAEFEVLEGLDLDRVRPWIIVIEATAPRSSKINRAGWEQLLTDRGYDLSHFDGLNCFYVAEEAAALKEGLALPANVFDDFVRWPEWASTQKAIALERESTEWQGRARGLEETLIGATGRAEKLERLVETMRAKYLDLQSILLTEQAQRRHLSERVGHLEMKLARGSVRWTLERVLSRLRLAGDRLTGGGARALAKRSFSRLLRRAMDHPRLTAFGRALLKPYPGLATKLYQFATTPDPRVASPLRSEAGLLSSGNQPAPIPLSASASMIYLKLQAAMSNSCAGGRLR